ncbi:MAG: helix-turn-helix transcriptional regulator, partial [Chloroflexi bacterium]|nr:helix-turn-helix transcriptional regulator [Chloroflexota bacterium]
MADSYERVDSFGSWVRHRRKVLDLTQAALAQRVGCAEVTIRKIEANRVGTSRTMAERLALCLKIPPDQGAIFLQVAAGERSVARLPNIRTGLELPFSTPPGRSSPRLALPHDTVPAPAPLPPGSRMPLRRNPLFVGRDADLRQLARTFTASRTAAIGQPEIAAATGLGGIGKTQLACEFVHRYGQYFAGGVFWLNFADPAAVAAEVAACGGADAMHLGDTFDALPLNEQVKLVLAAWAGPQPRLLVFDNCEDEALFQKWWPTYGGCSVLITSRRHHWSTALGVHMFPLHVLHRTDSLTLLRSFHPDFRADDADLIAIAEVLGHLPLALHLAGSFLAKYRHVLTPAQYLMRVCVPTILDDRSLQAAGISPTKHVQHVARTFEQSYEQLDPADPKDVLARTLLVHAASFAPGDPLPRWLLLRTLRLVDEDVEGALVAEDALIRLIDLGLLETDARGSLRLHRLVAAFAQAVLDHTAAQATVEETMIRVAHDINNGRDPRRLLAIQTHLRFLTEKALARADARAAELCYALGHHLFQLGVYGEAQHYLEQALAIQQRVLGAEHLHTTHSLSHLGILFMAQGQYAVAQSYLEQTLAIVERVFGPDHLDTAGTLNNLGGVHWSQGQYAAAQGYLEQALAIQQRVLGSDHLDTARSLGNLG